MCLNDMPPPAAVGGAASAAANGGVAGGVAGAVRGAQSGSGKFLASQYGDKKALQQHLEEDSSSDRESGSMLESDEEPNPEVCIKTEPDADANGAAGAAANGGPRDGTCAGRGCRAAAADGTWVCAAGGHVGIGCCRLTWRRSW